MTDAAPNPGMTPAEIDKALAQVLSMIDTAERLSRDHQVVNLTSLDRRVGQLCAAVAALPPSDARRFAEGLGRLVTGLDRLEAATQEAFEAITATRGGLDETLSELPSSTRANAAYARALAVAPLPEPEPAADGRDRRRADRRRVDRRQDGDRRQGDRRGSGPVEMDEDG
ncbi:hypothetical protein [Roseospira goensis]|uniref:Uncharacterized protein n=1 Tax=Roseospira goensis TaxID=391922 RepID=A0A7W6RZK6_9PROT|nr:hypothetical protein [Roseospira goensis]MBB4286146.1 hypothetical protein [Roseospira goensis]